LGLTFLEINDRAYVRTVDPGSAAEMAGIQPQDCVQFACVVGGPKFDDLQTTISSSAPPSSSFYAENETDRLDSRAKKYVLDCERRGMRTSYEQLRELFAGCTLPPKGAENDPMRTPPRNGAPPNNNSSTRVAFDDDVTIGSNSLMLADSAGGMFEHTKKNNTIGSRRVPSLPKGAAKNVTRNVTNVTRSAAGRCLMNDEDDGEGSQGSGIRRRSSKTSQLETPITPIKSENVISTASPRHFGVDGVVEQELYPVVMVLRRTVQRKIVSPGGSTGWSSPGLSLKGAMFGIPTFRMDDECDRAAALVRQLAPAGGESANPDQEKDIEASIIRGMIKNAIGLGFVRLSKVVVGFSLQGGSGILISRLPDGSWSAPSAIGVYGFGLGLQFGLEVADFIFIIQTQEGMEHFKRGGNFAVGGNIGATVVSCGREAYGAASIGACTGTSSLEEQIHHDDNITVTGSSVFTDDRSMHSYGMSTVRTYEESKKKDSDGAPIVAYAKSQGLYFGVSVDGLKFFTRNDINSRTYKFSMLSEIASHDILNGAVAPPPEADDLYAALNGVEIINEAAILPQSPLMFKNDSMNDWRYDRSIAAHNGKIIDDSNKRSKSYPLFSFHSTLNREEANECAMFETKFKRFLYEGVTVQYLMPNLSPTLSGMTRREKRTLWLMLPEVGSLRLGLVSRQKQPRSDASTMDDATAVSSVAQSIDEDYHRRDGINLSKRDSMSLTDITLLSQDPNTAVRLSRDDATEHLRLISVQDVSGKSLLFIADSNSEAELLVCGLKLLLECETARLGVRGGVPINEIGGKLRKGSLTPAAARGSPLRSPNPSGRQDASKRVKDDVKNVSKYSSLGEIGSSSDGDEYLTNVAQSPVEERNWPQASPSPNHRESAERNVTPRAQVQTQESSTYVLGKEISNDVASDVSLPLPFDLCRLLLLDSASPLNQTWEIERGDSDYQHGEWTFPPSSPRMHERGLPEEQLISSGSMLDAQRVRSYCRTRNREKVALSEAVFVEKDDNQGLVFIVADRAPRRGFSAKARIQLRPYSPQSCAIKIISEIRPVGKNLNNQAAVHKAFVLVLDEMISRYGIEGTGLLAVFLEVCKRFSASSSQSRAPANPSPTVTPPRNTVVTSPTSSITSFKDMIGSKGSPQATSKYSGNTSSTPRSSSSPNRSQQVIAPVRPVNNTRSSVNTVPVKNTSSMSKKIDSKVLNALTVDEVPQRRDDNVQGDEMDDFANFSNFDNIPRNPVTVEVKPLPKIRLDLCPVPREEDEDEDSEAGDAKNKKKSKTSRKHRRSSKSTRA
jgi:lipid-binding SYLF domain-containing protein